MNVLKKLRFGYIKQVKFGSIRGDYFQIVIQVPPKDLDGFKECMSWALTRLFTEVSSSKDLMELRPFVGRVGNEFEKVSESLDN